MRSYKPTTLFYTSFVHLPSALETVSPIFLCHTFCLLISFLLLVCFMLVGWHAFTLERDLRFSLLVCKKTKQKKNPAGKRRNLTKYKINRKSGETLWECLSTQKWKQPHQINTFLTEMAACAGRQRQLSATTDPFKAKRQSISIRPENLR